MAIVDTGVKLRPDLPYMTAAERGLFKKTQKYMSFFRKSSCERCKAEIPKNKKFCSKTCFEGDKHGGDSDDD